MNSFNCLVLIIISLTAFTSVDGLRCYKCNSLNKPYCSDPYDPPDTGELALEYQTDCDKDIDKLTRDDSLGLGSHIQRNGSQYVAVCRKLVQKVDNIVRVFRSCGWYDASTEEPICSLRTGSLGVTSTHCVCRGDLCNHGIVSQSTSIINLLINTSLIILGFKLFNLSI